MKVVSGLQTWWQTQTGEEDTPFDGDSSSFVASVIFHIGLLLALGLTPLIHERNQVTLLIETPTAEDEPEIIELPQEFVHSDLRSVEIGAHSEHATEVAMSQAPVVAELLTDIPTPEHEITETEMPQIEVNLLLKQPTGKIFSNLAVKGETGVGTTGAPGAIDRITQEILRSLQERKTLVVWLFDQSASLIRQRGEIHDRFDRIYEELGIIEASGSQVFSKHDEKPLLTSIVAFGDKVNLLTKKPTDNLAEIKNLVATMETDMSGVERTFTAIYMAADQYKNLRLPNKDTGEPSRNVMLVVVTDEVGDDQEEGLEQTVRKCQQLEMPVYVVGIPAPFGRKEALVKWVDPDPQFDQTPQWGEVDQGPESFLPERLKISFSGKREEDELIDSGFGPFSLTRLCVETGGIYFAVHPNRNVGRAVSRNETAEFSAHMKHFFDPNAMRRYRPDYVSQEEYMRRASQNKARASLLKAAQMSWVSPMEAPALRFVKRSEAEFSNALSEAQKGAAKLEPKMEALYETLKLGEADREKEHSPRWQAGYDLAMGQVLAIKVRTESYNAMLAAAKRGLKFEDDKNNTWILQPADEISVGSKLEKDAEKAREYLQRAVKENPDTPWAMLAQRELDNPVGWKWKEEFTDLSPRNAGGGGNGNAPPPADDARRMMNRPQKRPVPKL